MKEITIKKNDANQRLDKFLSKTYHDFPISLIYKYIRTKHIKLNKKRCKNNDILNEGDIISLYVKDESLLIQKENYEFFKAPKKLDIIFEDENIIIVNKAPGILVHPDKNYHFDSLINRLTHYLYDKGEYDPKSENSFAPAFANRIDRNTGGLVIAAKNSAALRILNQKIKDREIHKFYLARVVGIMSKREDTISGYLVKNESKNKVTISKNASDTSKKIITKYKVLSNGSDSSLLEIELLTGRTHQIRAHLSYIGHPLLGDTKYMNKKLRKNSDYKYQALYSYKLIFDFSTDAGILNYLNGKEISISKNKIWFI